MPPVNLSAVLTPSGHLVLAPSTDAPALPDPLQRQLQDSFAHAHAPGHALLHLGLREVGTALPPIFAFWRDFAARYVTALCATAEATDDDTPVASVTAPSTDDLNSLLTTAPPMAGGEYLTATVLESFWHQIDAACREERTHSKHSLQAYLKANNPAWNLVGRVHFNLAENRGDEEAPFAFIATYTTKLSAQGRAQHLPLAEALREYAGAKNKTRLLSLLQPVQQATTQCGWLRAMVEAGEIYHPLRWTAPEAFQFLTDVPLLEGAGIVVRSPSAWKRGRPARPKVKATVGGTVPSVLGKEALL
ncbi:MAG: helicase, partial [Gammaproteobacteria bacterium]|nr:helicase [Gammaproteobacteria bacterium]